MAEIQMKVFGNIVLTQKIMLFIIVNRENLTKGWAKRHGSTVTFTVHKSRTPLNPQIFKNTSSCHLSLQQLLYYSANNTRIQTKS